MLDWPERGLCACVGVCMLVLEKTGALAIRGSVGSMDLAVCVVEARLGR